MLFASALAGLFLAASCQQENLEPAAKGNAVTFTVEAPAALQTKAITDTGGYYTTDTVDGALQEIGAELAGINTLIGSGVII